MLIWKIIDANPGIDRAGIWERVEHGIPEGYALRRYAARLVGALSPSPTSITTARRALLNEFLCSMNRDGIVLREGIRQHARFTALRPPRYFGNPDTIDETGTKAVRAAVRQRKVPADWLDGGLMTRGGQYRVPPRSAACAAAISSSRLSASS